MSAAVRYELAEAANGGAEQTVYSGSNRSWPASGKANGKANGSYAYRVRACSASTCGNYSGTITVTVQSGIPSLAITPNPSTSGVYTASWGAVTGATRYVLKEMPAGGTERTAYDGPNNFWTSPSMPDGTHSYRVQACNGSCGALSAPAMVTVETPLVQGLGVSPNPAVTITA